MEEVKISLEALVPEKHILRTIDKAIDFSFIYEEVEGLYSEKGRPGIDPVSLFEPQEVIKKESTTDSECGLFVKGEHERCFAYSAQTACDKHGFVLDFEVGAGNLHDGQMFHELYKKMDLRRTQIVALDAGYKTPGVIREIFLSGKILKYTTTNREGYREYKSDPRVCQNCPCLRYTNYRGLAKVKVQVALIFSCLNLKKLAKRKLLNFIFFFCPRSY